MTTSKEHLITINRLVLSLIKVGYLKEARMVGMLLKNRDKDAIYMLNKKFGRIFTDEEIGEIADVIDTITSKFIPASIRGSEAQEAEFMCGENKNVRSLFNRRRT